MPGLFFEFCILLANPNLAWVLSLRSQESFGSGPYLIIFLGLFFGFVIGTALMLFVNLIQFSVNSVYRLILFLWKQFQRRILLPYLTKLTHTPGKAVPHWVQELYIQTFKEVSRVIKPELLAAYRWWRTLATLLLVRKYGLREKSFPVTSFFPLEYVLTSPSPEEVRGSMLVNASHATGWAALVACKFAPMLQSRWYVAFAVFLILFGLFHDFFVAKRLFNPEIGDLLRMRAILREFPKMQPTELPKQIENDHEAE